MNYGTGGYGRELDRSFTIPRRREDEGGYSTTNDFNPVLTSSYGNIPNNYPRFQSNTSTPNFRDISSSTSTNNFSKKFWGDSSNSPTYETDIGSLPNAQKRTWSSANFTPAPMKYKDTFEDLYDRTLPKELLSLYQPLFCKLCMIQLTSNAMAKLHYKSKNHDKRLRTWLIDYAERTGQPVHERATTKRLKKDEEFDPKYFRCDVCDLVLTGKLHAESHYMGRNHQRAMGTKDPAGKGFYNDDGKWVRTVAAKDDKSGRDGFGQEFTKKERQALQQQILQQKSYKCEMCDILVTSEAQMDAHIQGQKHKKKLKLKETGSTLVQRLAGNDDFELPISDNGSTVERRDSVGQELTKKERQALQQQILEQKPYKCEICDISMLSEAQMESHLHGQKHKKKLKQNETGLTIAQRVAGNDDFEVPISDNGSTVQSDSDAMASYRTPSGYYYCKSCDLSLNSSVQFMQHLKSKKHKRNYAEKFSKDAEDTTGQSNLPEPVSSDDILAHL